MMKKTVDEYIARSEDFAQPILEHWRQLIYSACPDVEETIKWGIPHFDYMGDFMCVMASYKNHCSFSFIKAELMTDPRLNENKDLKPVQRYLGKITKLTDLPPDKEFLGFVKEAMALNEKGIKFYRNYIGAPKSDKPKPAVEMPDYFSAKLATNPKAKEVFDSKPPSFRKEYIAWIVEAKTDVTREKRMEEAIGWIAEGKSRFWKYAK
ncbi:YdeI family protein [Chitinophaga sp. SYP-B3965]|uniref:YdeI/OmpD-associated family protein n=1 Tax=Chitinophaga sp. SYP-B3965 TaxID=2663120 RepID=UPI001C12A0C7|nr:YdeI/OmpD-associated family protein [Chitinophaga sp. SYP-B3965]